VRCTSTWRCGCAAAGTAANSEPTATATKVSPDNFILRILLVAQAKRTILD
jgi:hypothetical protein